MIKPLNLLIGDAARENDLANAARIDFFSAIWLSYAERGKNSCRGGKWAAQVVNKITNDIATVILRWV